MVELPKAPDQRWADDIVRAANIAMSRLSAEWCTDEEKGLMVAAGRAFESMVLKITDEAYRRRYRRATAATAATAATIADSARDEEFEHGSNMP